MNGLWTLECRSAVKNSSSGTICKKYTNAAKIDYSGYYLGISYQLLVIGY